MQVIDAKVGAAILRELADMLEANTYVQINEMKHYDWSTLNKESFSIEWSWPRDMHPPEMRRRITLGLERPINQTTERPNGVASAEGPGQLDAAER